MRRSLRSPFLLLVLLAGCMPTLSGLDDDDVTAPADDDDTVPQSYVVVEPDALDFGAVDVPGPSMLELTLRNQGTGDLRIESVVSTNTDLFSLLNGDSFDVLVAPDEQTALQVGFTPGWNGEMSGTLTIGTNDPIAGDIEIPLTGTGVAPAIDLWPVSYDFGNLPIGCPAAVEFTIGNEGAATLRIHAVEYEDFGAGGDLDMVHGLLLPLDLEPGQTAGGVLSYLPHDAEPDSGQLTVTSDDPVSPSWSVAQFGLGHAASTQTDELVASADQAVFSPSATPVVETIEVGVAGVPVFIGWSWDAGQEAVVFDAEHLPGDGVAVALEYSPWGC
jgi:hypothetical protein